MKWKNSADLKVYEDLLVAGLAVTFVIHRLGFDRLIV